MLMPRSHAKPLGQSGSSMSACKEILSVEGPFCWWYAGFGDFLIDHRSFRSHKTHNIALTAPIADFVVSIGLDGVPHEAGSDISAALERDPALAREAEVEQEEADMDRQIVDAVNNKEEDKSDGKLILAEEIVEGRITWTAFKLLLVGLGGKHHILFMATWMGGFGVVHMFLSFGVWFLGYWGSQYENHVPEEVDVP